MDIVGTIQSACPGDAPDIYALITEAFGDEYLPYTIYQSPKSKSYLKKLITTNYNKNPKNLLVLKIEENIQGYYQSFVSSNTCFLNYIAVRSANSGKGLGGKLLSHFEYSGKNLGCNRFSLDVFEKNKRALNWYKNKGYIQEEESILSLIALGQMSKYGPSLEYQEKEWKAAIAREEECGFSQLECLCGQGSILLGLINGNACKLLNFTGLSFEEAISAINTHFKEGQRDGLIVSSPGLPENHWPLKRQDRVFRLKKDVKI